MGIKSVIAAICNMTYSSFTPKNPGVLHAYGLPDQFFQSFIILFSDKNVIQFLGHWSVAFLPLFHHF